MNPDEIMGQLEIEPAVVALLISAFAILLVVIALRKRLLLRLREWRIQRRLNQIGCEQIRNLVCPDGLDGYYRIDRLALVQDAILLIAYKPFGGNIYCAQHISEWTQVVGQKSFKFENPLFELENQLTSLKLLTGGVPLHAFLAFNRSAEFPKGHPDAILLPDNIPDRYLGTNCNPVNPQIQAAWDLLKAQRNQLSTAAAAGVKT